MSTRDEQAWHLDKRIPIALIAGMVGQTLALVWWAATLSSQVAANTGAISEFRTARIPERLPVIEIQIATINEGMTRLDRKLDYLLYSPSIQQRPQTMEIRPQQW